MDEPKTENVAPTPYDRLHAEVKELTARTERFVRGARDALGSLKGRVANLEAAVSGMGRRWDDLFRVLYEHSAASLRAERIADEANRDMAELIRRVHDLETLMAEPAGEPPDKSICGPDRCQILSPNGTG